MRKLKWLAVFCLFSYCAVFIAFASSTTATEKIIIKHPADAPASTIESLPTPTGVKVDTEQPDTTASADTFFLSPSAPQNQPGATDAKSNANGLMLSASPSQKNRTTVAPTVKKASGNCAQPQESLSMPLPGATGLSTNYPDLMSLTSSPVLPSAMLAQQQKLRPAGIKNNAFSLPLPAHTLTLSPTAPGKHKILPFVAKTGNNTDIFASPFVLTQQLSSGVPHSSTLPLPSNTAMTTNNSTLQFAKKKAFN